MVTEDPLLARRSRAARLASTGQRIGYALLAVAVVCFFVGYAGEFTEGVVTLITVAIGLGSVILAPAIVLGYAVKAAARDDRNRG